RSAVELAEFLGNNPAYFRLMLRDLSVPLGYDPLNRRFTLSHGNSIPLELKDMQERARRMIEQLNPGAENQLDAENFLSSIIGTLLVKLSWSDKPPANDQEEKVIDMEPVNAYINTLVDSLLR
ncbi:MAG: hypothetical protein MI867_10835, partial [Pseudomonadales bacterium]|nr:hypothetical protein [Pseudomonadales bacterium]